MKKVESIWAELSAKAQEVELSEEQKVELASTVAQSLERSARTASDMRDAAQVLSAQADLAQKFFKLFDELKFVKESLNPDKARSREGILLAWVSEAEDALAKIEATIKELGINPSAVEGYNETKKALPKIQASYNRLKGTADLVEREYNRKL